MSAPSWMCVPLRRPVHSSSANRPTTSSRLIRQRPCRGGPARWLPGAGHRRGRGSRPRRTAERRRRRSSRAGRHRGLAQPGGAGATPPPHVCPDCRRPRLHPSSRIGPGDGVGPTGSGGSCGTGGLGGPGGAGGSGGSGGPGGSGGLGGTGGSTEPGRPCSRTSFISASPASPFAWLGSSKLFTTTRPFPSSARARSGRRPADRSRAFKRLVPTRSESNQSSGDAFV